MDKLLERLLAHVEEQQEENVKSIRVGRISTPLLEKLNKINDNRRNANNAMQKDINDYVEEMKAVIEDRISEMKREFYASGFNKEADLAWEEVYEELELPDEIREDNFSVNRNTGVVTREVSLDVLGEEEPTNPKVKVINISTAKK